MNLLIPAMAASLIPNHRGCNERVVRSLEAGHAAPKCLRHGRTEEVFLGSLSKVHADLEHTRPMVDAKRLDLRQALRMMV
jgi:hypothetical protein